MPIVFTPYLRKLRERATESEGTSEEGNETEAASTRPVERPRRLLLGAAIAGGLAVLARWRRRGRETERTDR